MGQYPISVGPSLKGFVIHRRRKGIFSNKYSFNNYSSTSGSVPRTFVGALTVALPTGVVSYLSQCPKAITYSLARMVLGLYVVWCFSTFRRAVKKIFGGTVSNVQLLSLD